MDTKVGEFESWQEYSHRLKENEMEARNSKVLDEVMMDLCLREKKGLNTYGTTVDRTDLTELDWLQNLYEELLDGAVYLKKIISLKRAEKYKEPMNGSYYYE